MNKQHKVIMLPADDSRLMLNEYQITLNNNGEYLTEGIVVNANPVNIDSIPQHLYILSNDKIKINDWCYSKRNIVAKFGSFENSYENECYKIIATTDPKLTAVTAYYKFTPITTDYYTGIDNIIPGLPSIPQSFIKEYCESNGKIDTVNVEYQYISIQSSSVLTEDEALTEEHYTKLLLNNNEIVIHLLETKMYTKSEVMQLLDDVLIEYSDKTLADIPEWIHNNLN